MATAHKANPGDSNWNEITDLDKNSIIDVLDITKVAIDYGKSA